MLYIMRKPKQFNIRADDEFILAVYELQRLADSIRLPSMTDAVRRAVLNELARERERVKRKDGTL